MHEQSLQHLKKCEHNKAFISYGISSNKEDFSDWEVIARFYAALHIVEAVSYKIYGAPTSTYGESPSDHTNRYDFMLCHTDTFNRDALKQYSKLQSLANKARYYTTLITSAEAKESQENLEDFEYIMRDYLPKQND